MRAALAALFSVDTDIGALRHSLYAFYSLAANRRAATFFVRSHMGLEASPCRKWGRNYRKISGRQPRILPILWDYSRVGFRPGSGFPHFGMLLALFTAENKN